MPDVKNVTTYPRIRYSSSMDDIEVLFLIMEALILIDISFYDRMRVSCIHILKEYLVITFVNLYI